MRRLLYEFARRTLPQDTRTRLKSQLERYVESPWRRLNAVLLGKVSLEQLQRIICDVVPAGTRVLTVHSAFDPLRFVYEGNLSDFAHLLDPLLERDVTLLVPTFAHITIPLEDYVARHPVFNAQRTPSGMGLITELYRRRPDAVRSLHPTHSMVAIGPLATELVGDHHLQGLGSSPVSPLAKMLRYPPGGILGIGVQYYRALTHVHVVEELMGDKFPVKLTTDERVRVRMIDQDKEEIPFDLLCPNDAHLYRRLSLIKKYRMDGGLRAWHFRTIPFYYGDANRLVDAMIDAARRGLTIYGDVNDPSFPRSLRRAADRRG